MRFGRSGKGWSVAGRRRNAGDMEGHTNGAAVATEERNALLELSAPEERPMATLEDESLLAGDPTQRLLTALGRFQRQVAKAEEGGRNATWCDECMHQLITGIEIAQQQGWSDVEEALTDSARVLQSYEDAGDAPLAVPFLQDSYEILCLMVGDIIVDNVRSGVMVKWRERYKAAVSDLASAGIRLVEDDTQGRENAPVKSPAAAAVHAPDYEDAWEPAASAATRVLDDRQDDGSPFDFPESLHDAGPSAAPAAELPVLGGDTPALEEQEDATEQRADSGDAFDAFLNEEDENEEVEDRALSDAMDDPWREEVMEDEDLDAVAGEEPDGFTPDDQDAPQTESHEPAFTLDLIDEAAGQAPQEEEAAAAPSLFETEPKEQQSAPRIEAPAQKQAEIFDAPAPAAPAPVAAAPAPAPAAPEPGTPEYIVMNMQAAMAQGNFASAKALALELAMNAARLEADRARAAVDAAEQALEATSSAIASGSEAVALAERQVQQREEAIQAQETALEACRRMCGETREALTGVEGEIQSLNDQIAALMARRDKELANKAELEAQLDGQMQEAGRTETALEACRQAEMEARDALVDGREHVAALEEKRAEQEAAIEKARRDLERQETGIGEIARTLQGLVGGDDAQGAGEAPPF